MPPMSLAAAVGARSRFLGSLALWRRRRHWSALAALAGLCTALCRCRALLQWLDHRPLPLAAALRPAISSGPTLLSPALGARLVRRRAGILDALLALDEEEDQFVSPFALANGGGSSASSAETEIDGGGWESLQEQLGRRSKEMKERHETALNEGQDRGHQPVLLQTAMSVMFQDEFESPTDPGFYDGTYVDCTFGRGGMSQGLLKRLSSKGRVIAFDLDMAAEAWGRRLEQEDPRFKFVRGPYSALGELLDGVPIHGVLLDAGVSSPQYDDILRGFSSQDLVNGPDRPLDMRFDNSSGPTVAEWVEGATVAELAWVLSNSWDTDISTCTLLLERVAESVMIDQERFGPYTSMRHFCDAVMRVKGYTDGIEKEDWHPKIGKVHPARLVTGSLRSFINHESEQLRQGAESALKVLVPRGRFVICSFRPNEGRVLKQWQCEFEDPSPEIQRKLSRQRLGELYPLTRTDLNYSVRLIGKILKASTWEIDLNPRSRSGKNWVFEKAPRLSPKVSEEPRAAELRFKEPYQPPLREVEPLSFDLESFLAEGAPGSSIRGFEEPIRDALRQAQPPGFNLTSFLGAGAPESLSDSAEEAEAKPKRARKASAKAATAVVPALEEEVDPKPKRGRKVGATGVVAAPAEPPEAKPTTPKRARAAAAAAASSDEEAAAEPKPKPRKSTAKRTVEVAEEETPKPRKKTTKTASEAEDEAPKTKASTTKNNIEAAEAKPKPKKTTTKIASEALKEEERPKPMKTTAKVASEALEARPKAKKTTTTVEVAEEEPKPKKKTTTKKASEAVEEQPKTKTPTKKTKKASSWG